MPSTVTHRQLQRKIALWQKRLALLGVSHWRFTVKIVPNIEPQGSDPSDSDIAARATTSEVYDNVEFLFKASILDSKTEEELDELIVHEWLHVADRDRDEAEQAIMESLGPQAADAWEDRFWRLREGQVDRLARLIVLPYH